MKTARTQEEIRKNIIAYFENNEEEYNEVIEELDELYNDTEPTEILTRAFYGYDEMYTDKDGHHTEAFNPNRYYFRYNGYGNLVSTDYKDYTDHLDEYFLDDLIDHAAQLYYIPDEVKELIDELEEIEEN